MAALKSLFSQGFLVSAVPCVISRASQSQFHFVWRGHGNPPATGKQRLGFGGPHSSSRCSTNACASVDAAIPSSDLAFSLQGFQHTVVESPAEWAIEYGRLLPCPSRQLPPRVEHMILKQSGNVVDVVSGALGLPRLYVEDLIDYGAVHYALLCPPPPPTASDDQFELYKQFSVVEDRAKRPSLKGKTVREAQKTRRIFSKKQVLEEGSYLRIHVHPKRFSRCYEVDWRPRIVVATESYVVLDKPSGVSVGGTVDNLQETCATFAARALGMPTRLAITHQIDSCTEGCVVLAKTKEFASKFHELLRERKVKKVYRALAAAPVPLGTITHFMRVDRLPPRLISKVAHDGWQLCQMEILNCKRVLWPSNSTSTKLGIKDCGWKPQSHAYECTLQLITGRTHQIRAQFAALNAPLVGDSMYTPASIARLKFPDVDPLLDAPISEDKDSWAGNIKDRRDGGVMERWVAMHGREPDFGLGLQASQISWEDDHIYSYKAGPSWWETG